MTQLIEVSSEQGAALLAHNILRKLHNVQPMKWNLKLANQSKEWAKHLAKQDRIEHSSMEGYGENIYYYRGGKTHVYDAVLKWYSTIKNYNFDNPKFTYTAGTFSQLIWDASTELGTGIAYNPTTRVTYIVAQYISRGNSYHGEPFAQHVKRPLSGLPAYIPDISELIPQTAAFPMFSGIQIKKEKESMETLVKDLCNHEVEGWSGTAMI